MNHINNYDSNSKNKITVRTYSFSHCLETGDFETYDDFISNLESCKKRALEHLGDIDICLAINDNYDLQIEFWGARLETDSEYAQRQGQISKSTEIQKQRDLDRLKHIANELGYKIVKNNI